MSKNEFQQVNAGEEEKGPHGRAGLGTLFRNEREKKGLSYDQLSEITKIRPYTLKALENEQWEELPESVFVIGFIRSYARALGLDEGQVVSHYQETTHVEPSQFEPLGGPARNRKAFSFILIFFLLVIASFFYLWKGYINTERIQNTEATGNGGDRSVSSADMTAMPDGTVPEMFKKQKESATEPKGHQVLEELVPEFDPHAFSEEISEDLPTQERETLISTKRMSSITPSHSPLSDVADQELILKANVRERTYIRILVDDQTPREYVFRPGSRPEWRAKEGFELLIGNAGGVDLEFDGNMVGKLGKPGQVVRLKLPEKYQGRGEPE
jgi:cytoskeleton protein RodZ